LEDAAETVEPGENSWEAREYLIRG
jgi:hypothetical protein